MYLNPYPLLEQALLSDNPDEKGKLTQALFAQLGKAEGLTVEESKPVDCRFAGHPLRPRFGCPFGSHAAQDEYGRRLCGDVARDCAHRI